MAKLFMLDDKGILEKYCTAVIKKYKEFKVLTNLNFLYVWRLEKPEYDKESRMMSASIKALSPRERDVYFKDVELRVYRPHWLESTKEQKLQLCYHELRHVQVEIDENFTIMEDDDGRIKIKIIPHDLVITAFKKEIEEFGLPADLSYVIKNYARKR